MTLNKQLIVLDLNGVLVDRVHKTKGCFLNHEFDFITPNGYYVFVRPYARRFLTFAFRHFDVAVRSSMQKHNTAFVLERIMTRSQRDRLLFVCTPDQQPQAEPKNTRTFYFTNRLRRYELRKILAFLQKSLKPVLEHGHSDHGHSLFFGVKLLSTIVFLCFVVPLVV